MEETQPKNQGGCPAPSATRAKSTYNKEKYEANKEKILAYRKRRYRELNAYKYDVIINQGEFIISFT